MSTPHQVRPTFFLSPQVINSVYIPSLLVLGVSIVKTEWLPYAIAVSLVLGAWNFYTAGENPLCACQNNSKVDIVLTIAFV